MRTVLKTEEIAHAWAHQTQEHATAPSAMSFHGRNFKSYNTVIASLGENKRGQRAYFVTSDTFSVSTSRHRNLVIDSISGSATVFFVDKPEVSSREYIEYPSGKYNPKKHGWQDKKDGQSPDHKANLAAWTQRAEHMTLGAATARQPKKDRLLGEVADIVKVMREYVAFFDIKGVKYPAVANADQLPAILEAKQKRDAAVAKKAEKAKQISDAKRREETVAQHAAWLDGTSDSTYGWADAFDTELRIVGDQVETSRGAEFPVSDAKRGLELVNAAMSSGREWRRNGFTCKLGCYQIDSIATDGTVTAGCHVVKYDAIQRIAAQIAAL